MSRVYTNSKEVTVGAVFNGLKNLQGKQKDKFKAKAFEKVKIKNFNLEEYEVDILDDPQEVDGRLYVNVAARKNGVSLPVSNPLIFVNPPIMVPDGTFYKKTTNSGEIVDVHNYKEDIEEALKIIIVDVLKAVT